MADEVKDDVKTEIEGAVATDAAATAVEDAEAERAAIWKEVAAEEATDAGQKVVTQDSTVTDTTGLPGKKEDLAPDVKVEDGVSAAHGKVSSLEKALNDTKLWARRLEDKNAELMRQMEDFKKGTGSVDAVTTAHKAVQDTQGKMDEILAPVAEDYPELKPVLEAFSSNMKFLQEEVTQLKTARKSEAERTEKEAALDLFNKEIKPKVLETHKDFDAVVMSNEYWDWAEKQRPSLRVAAMDSADPEDITWAISEFKRHKASAVAGDLADADANGRARKVTQSASMLRGGASNFPTRARDAKGELSWKEAGNLLKEQGVET